MRSRSTDVSGRMVEGMAGRGRAETDQFQPGEKMSYSSASNKSIVKGQRGVIPENRKLRVRSIAHHKRSKKGASSGNGCQIWPTDASVLR